jgi:hypothetical protein
MGEAKNYPPYLDYPKPYKMKTNADLIRAMSDEELAHLLTNCSVASEIDRKFCYQTIADWLRKPAEEIDNE